MLSSFQKLLKLDRENLSLEDSLALLHPRCIVLPKKSSDPMLQLLNASHSGITKTIALAQLLKAYISGQA